MAILHFTLAVTDVGRARHFFEAALGWRPLSRPGNIPFPAAWLEIAPGQEVHLIEVPDYRPSPFEREYGRHVAVSYPRAEWDALRERLRREGAELIAPARESARERFFFRGPDGYIFEVVES